MIVLVALSLYYAWRYSIIDIDPDQAMYMFESMGVGWYGKDYIDCKSPAIHIWFWIISKIVGRNIVRIRFTHYFLIGMSSLLVFWLTGSFLIALAFLVMVNSGWLWAFNGNVGQIPAVLVVVGLASGNDIVLSLLLLVAVFFEPKLIVAALIMAVVGLWWWYIPLAWLGGVILFGLYNYWNDVYRWLIEGNLAVPKAMTKRRFELHKIKAWMTWPASVVYMYILPWLFVAVYNKPDVIYWLPVLAYLVLIHIGLEVRPNHLLPIVGWIALALPDVTLVLALIAADWISGGFYWQWIWRRFYRQLADANAAAKLVGLKLKELQGTIWVNDMHSGVYLYAEKPVPYGLAEQIEIREVSHKRRKRMVELWRASPADYVVTGVSHDIEFNGKGYKLIGQADTMRIFEKEKR